jgi:serine protease DegQ
MMKLFATFVTQTVLAGLLAFLLLWAFFPRPGHEDVRAEAAAVAGSAGPKQNPTASLPPAAAGSHPSYRSAVAAALPSVVNIYTAKAAPPRRGAAYMQPGIPEDEESATTSSLGSGVIWSRDGFIVTNNHVVEGADAIAVIANGLPPMPAKVVGIDPESDLAVLKVQAKDLKPIPRGSSSKLEVGDIVLAIGNPFGVGQTVTQGIVSATGRNHLGINTFENFIQTDAAINPGNSGGALVDSSGGLVGINTAIYTRSEGSVGIGFAIPMELVDTVATQLIGTGKVERGYLGVRTRELDRELAQAYRLKDMNGVMVAAVLSGGPADRAGIKPGDVIRTINGKAVADSTELVAAAGAAKPGEIATLGVHRGGDLLTAKVRLGKRPPARPQPPAGH